MTSTSQINDSSSRFAAFLDRHSRAILTGAVVLTLLLALPTILMDAPPVASQDPAGAVFDVQDKINDVFESPIHGIGMIVEARDGDMLSQAALGELLVNQNRLLLADEQGELAVGDLESQSFLYSYFDIESSRQVNGVTSLADAVDDVLRQHPLLSTTLAEASNEQVKFAIHTILANPDTAGLQDILSVETTSEPRNVLGQEIIWWESPALLFNVIADNEKLGGGSLAISVDGDETTVQKEEFNRELQRILRGDETNYRLWGIAIDVNLESADQGQAAGAFITLTAIIAVAIVGLTLRSYWAVAFTGVGLAALVIWLKGISTLVGIKGGLINDMLVPIAMIALGVDFAVHAIRRYQEERDRGFLPRKALTVGFTGVAGALALAFASDSIAFLSNLSAGIESVVHFGLAASIAVASAFVVLGLIVPIAVARAEEYTADLNISRMKNRVLKAFGGLGLAAGAGSAIIIMIAVSVPIGLVVLLIVSVIQLVIPLFFGRRSRRKRGPVSAQEITHGEVESTGFTERIVAQVVNQRYVVLGVTVVVTGFAVWMALRLESTFDVQDFFDTNSDFVVSLDMIDQHVGDRGGEPAAVLFEGDLADPISTSALVDVYANLQANQSLARGADGKIQVFTPDPLGIITSNTSSALARERARSLTGVEIIDAGGDAIPDNEQGIRAVLDLARAEGVYDANDQLVFNADRVATTYRRIDGVDYAVLSVQLPGTREQSLIGEAFDQLNVDLQPLDTAPGITSYGLTGSPFTRNEGLNATTSSLQKSIPIAAVAALVVLFIAMRSVRFAVVTVIPIGLVVTWLYAIMYVAGFGLNFVTATIGAVSIGVGIDYSIHMTERFREELHRSKSSHEAARNAAKGTGVALMASAASSIGGFAVMGFAPMPLFASYGILTAIMIALALAASILALPALLTLVAGNSVTTENRATALD